MGAREAKRSCPAVSHISNLIVLVGKLHFCVKKAAAIIIVSKSRVNVRVISMNMYVPPMVGSLFS